MGLDVGTTSTQMILSKLTAENRASGFAVPKLEITNREILYRSPVHFTPLRSHNLVDGAALRKLIEKEYEAAGIARQQVDTGAVIITGETSRKENAQTVLNELSDFAGDFVVATAGPDLESILAARGAGAYERSEGKRVLHMDIGGGTSNLCLLEDGKVLATGCLNVGGRLLKTDAQGRITYRSAVLEGITDLQAGDVPATGQLEAVADTLTSALEMAAGLRPPTDILCKLITEETGKTWQIPEGVIPSFSGGVADCIAKDFPDNAFGDLGPALGRSIRRSKLCAGDYILGRETIRATVIGAGCHSVQLSGSTVFHRNVAFPLKNVPVAVFPGETGETEVLVLPREENVGYAQVKAWARRILGERKNGPLLICMEQDMAKALGQALALGVPEDTGILCIDRVKLKPGDYLDVGAPVGQALPVVVKTLVLER